MPNQFVLTYSTIRNSTPTINDIETGESLLYKFVQPRPRIIGHHIRIRKFLPLSTIDLFVPQSFIKRPYSIRRPRNKPNQITNNILVGNNLPGNNGLNQDFSVALNRPLRFCPNCACGIPSLRQSFGDPDFPWLAALLNNNQYFCSGSLINDRYVLTAAHCMLRIEDILVGFLDFNQLNQFATPQQIPTFARRVSRILVHRFFRLGGAYNNDIALLHLDTPIIFNAGVMPVCLPPDFRNFDGFDGLATRWSNLNPNGSISPSMQQTNVRIVPNYQCRRTGYGQGITNNMLCARNLDSDDDTCQGDSGGPLQVTNGTFYILVGIVSWGESCPELTFPEVYTKVNNYLPWIYQNTIDACYC